jgi:hypothetical protein
MIDQQIAYLEREWKANNSIESLNNLLILLIRTGKLNEWLEKYPDVRGYAYGFMEWGPIFNPETYRPDFTSIINRTKSIMERALKGKKKEMIKTLSEVSKDLRRSGAFHHAEIICDQPLGIQQPTPLLTMDLAPS